MNEDGPAARTRRERDIYLEALAIGECGDREAFLRAACADDPGMRAAVEELLGRAERADSYFGNRPLDEGLTLPESGEDPPLEGPGSVIGPYKLLQEIGEGGFGIVYLAEQRSPVVRKVALKVLKPGMDSRQVIARFDAERQALALMEHPNIAKVLDAGAIPESRDRPYFVMELVRGVKITEFCDQNRLTVEQRLGLFIDVCLAVQHAHQKGVIHRDIKPSNILVTLHDGRPVPKVIDFGIAKATQQRLTDRTLFTRFEQFVGTPAYISPEQATMDGLDVDTRSDIYSLGIVLCELLTGRPPFDPGELARSGYDEIRRRIREDEPPSPSRLVRAMDGSERTRTAERRACDPRRLGDRLTGELDWIVMKAIDKDRTRRYESAAAFAADLRRFLNDEPVVAAAPSARYRLGKFARRHRSAILGAAVLVGILAAGAAVSAWQAVRAVRAEASEKQLRLEAEGQRDIANRERVDAENSRGLYRRLLYVSSMNLLSQDIALGNTPRVMEILRETSEQEDRAFEWFYWHAEAHGAVRILAGHPGGVRSLAFSGDGRWLVTGGEDHSARVWEAATGREVSAFTLHHGPVCALGVPANGPWVVTGGDDRRIRIWDLLSGVASGDLPGWNSVVEALAVTPDGRTAAALSEDGSVVVWDLAARAVSAVHEQLAAGTCLALSSDGARLLVGDADGAGSIVDARTTVPVGRLVGHRGALRAAAFDPTGRTVVTGGSDGTARVWEAGSGVLLQVLAGHRARVGAVAISPDGRRVLTGGDDLAVTLWDTRSGDPVRTFLGHRAAVAAVAFSPGGDLAASAGGDGMTRLWDVSEASAGNVLDGPNVATAVAISPDGTQVAATFQGVDHADSPRVWRLGGTGTPEFVLDGHGDWVADVAFSPDGAQIATSCFDQMVRVWDARTGGLVRRLATPQGRLTSVAFSPDGQWIVAGSYGGINVWDARGPADRERPAAVVGKGHIENVDVSADGRWIAAGDEDGSVTLWAVGTWEPVWAVPAHPGRAEAVGFSPDSRLLASGGSDGVVHAWRVDSGQREFSLRGHQAAVVAVAFAPDGRRVLTGSRDGTAKLWDPATRRETLSLGPHQGAVTGVAMRRDGSVIATAGWRWTNVRIWEAPGSEMVGRHDEAERVAERRLAERQAEVDARLDREAQERASGVGGVTRWLVLAPVPAAGFGPVFDDGPLAGIAVGNGAPGPREGDREELEGGLALAWQAARPLVDGVLDLHEVVGSSLQDSAAVAVSYLVADRDVEGATMRVGGDDVGRLFLNGVEVHSWGGRRSFEPDHDFVEGIRLRQGINLLTYQIYNGPGDWKISVRFTDADGTPLAGLVSTVAPGEPE